MLRELYQGFRMFYCHSLTITMVIHPSTDPTIWVAKISWFCHPLRLQKQSQFTTAHHRSLLNHTAICTNSYLIRRSVVYLLTFSLLLFYVERKFNYGKTFHNQFLTPRLIPIRHSKKRSDTNGKSLVPFAPRMWFVSPLKRELFMLLKNWMR